MPLARLVPVDKGGLHLTEWLIVLNLEPPARSDLLSLKAQEENVRLFGDQLTGLFRAHCWTPQICYQPWLAILFWSIFSRIRARIYACRHDIFHIWV